MSDIKAWTCEYCKKKKKPVLNICKKFKGANNFGVDCSFTFATLTGVLL